MWVMVVSTRMGVDIALLPRLAAEADPAELRRKVWCVCM